MAVVCTCSQYSANVKLEHSMMKQASRTPPIRSVGDKKTNTPRRVSLVLIASSRTPINSTVPPPDPEQRNYSPFRFSLLVSQPPLANRSKRTEHTRTTHWINSTNLREKTLARQEPALNPRRCNALKAARTRTNPQQNLNDSFSHTLKRSFSSPNIDATTPNYSIINERV